MQPEDKQLVMIKASALDEETPAIFLAKSRGILPGQPIFEFQGGWLHLTEILTWRPLTEEDVAGFEDFESAWAKTEYRKRQHSQAPAN